MQIPKNVVQTGEVDACHKIYIEDYVHTFLKQYQENEADFCLYGKCEKDGETTYYFIYGAAKEEPGWEVMESRYFSENQRIGEATFDDREAWLFFEDGYASALNGYFTFYEQNEDMQSYLIAMHQNQPGEKVVEVRSRAGRSYNAGRPADQAASDQTEPRHIRRRPVSYDQDTREKVLHAAQLSHLRKNEDRPSLLASGRMAVIALLLVLCVIGITALNNPQDMAEVGNFFADAARELDTQKQSDYAAASDSGGDQETGLIVEEKQVSQTAVSQDIAETAVSQDTVETAVFPVFSLDNGQTAPGQEALAQPSSAADSTDNAAEDGEQTTPETEAEASAEASEEASEEAEESNTNTGEADNAMENDTVKNTMGTSATVSYTIKNGDNLAAICRRQYGNTDKMEEIIALNSIKNPDHLIAGQKILLPN